MSSPPQRINVRSIISLFENQTTSHPVKNESTTLIKRTKSMHSLTRKTIYKSSERLTVEKPPPSELDELEQQIERLEASLDKYQLYAKDSHIYYQDQILHLLTDCVNIESKDDVRIINKKSEMIALIKLLSRTLNSRLPAEMQSSTSQKIIKVNTPLVVEEREEVDGQPPASVPSVKRLKDLFERKSSHNEGLKEIGAMKTPQRFLSFNGDSCDFKYVPYNEKMQSDVKFVVDDQSMNKERVVHNASLHRSSSAVDRIRSLFESREVFNHKPDDEDVEQNGVVGNGAGSSIDSDDDGGVDRVLVEEQEVEVAGDEGDVAIKEFAN